jgi:hypothetical protein
MAILKISGLIERTRSAANSLREDLEAIRAQRSALVVERHAVEAARISAGEVEAKIDAFLNAAANSAINVGWSDEWLSSPTTIDCADRLEIIFAKKPFGALIAFSPEHRKSIRTNLLECALATGSRNGLSGTDRAKKLDKIDAEIIALERAEEAHIMAVAEAGIRLPRREDADPAAVLEYDGEQ